MKINSINNNMSFKALIINRGEQTSSQKQIINNIVRNPFMTKSLINELDEKDTDIIVTANPDGKTVNLSLQTYASLIEIPFIPYNKYGKRFSTTIKQNSDDYNNKRNIFIQTALFLKHAQSLDLSSEKNIKEFDSLFNESFTE